MIEQLATLNNALECIEAADVLISDNKKEKSIRFISQIKSLLRESFRLALCDELQNSYEPLSFTTAPITEITGLGALLSKVDKDDRFGHLSIGDGNTSAGNFALARKMWALSMPDGKNDKSAYKELLSVYDYYISPYIRTRAAARKREVLQFINRYIDDLFLATKEEGASFPEDRDRLVSIFFDKWNECSFEEAVSLVQWLVKEEPELSEEELSL
jgi:hypothetical protein